MKGGEEAGEVEAGEQQEWGQKEEDEGPQRRLWDVGEHCLSNKVV